MEYPYEMEGTELTADGFRIPKQKPVVEPKPIESEDDRLNSPK